MTFRINPAWWPLLAAVSPFLAPFCLLKNARFQENLIRAAEVNKERLRRAETLQLPELDFLELTVLVEWMAEDGFKGEPGVSYLLRSNAGSLLYDLGFGPARRTLTDNAAKLGIGCKDIDALAISHLHFDHMGGMRAKRSNQVGWPEELGSPDGKLCFLPDRTNAAGFTAEVVEAPRLLAGGFATTGPLARSLFFMGWTEEQSLLARLKGKGLVVLTGCGHPTLEVILQMVRRLSDESLYAVCGGLHLPVTRGRAAFAGLEIQTLVGSGKPPWQRITDDDLAETIAVINSAGVRHLYLSAHDTCDHALARLKTETRAKTEVLRAGATYRL